MGFRPHTIEPNARGVPDPAEDARFPIDRAWPKRRACNSRLLLATKQLGVVSGHAELLAKEIRKRAPGSEFFRRRDLPAQHRVSVGLLQPVREIRIPAHRFGSRMR